MTTSTLAPKSQRSISLLPNSIAPASTRTRVVLMIAIPHNADMPEFDRFLGEYLTARFPKTLASRLRSAGLELLDNALRYGAVGSEPIFELALDEHCVEVRVSGSASPSRVQMFRDRMRDASRSESGSTLPPTLAGLRLLVSDASLEVSYSVDETRLVLRAVARR